ncbi:hypothetical protein EV644_106137 [Kribbella orskensis]|uniref:Uncharacterized protein n=1 Tax=Kribbella orskensis TaxID=2512216 RepID=A0ABY2BJW9_9ACTN|nr:MULTISPECIES: hypothetical protein [Kribbella]TCN40209.1 hypothetical protein EV642_105137 [Kribbella sp. VKM Ac-2500]TCO22829.1 hypothetical protein EV644_106137 [Kribbella orskensis]
MSITLATSITTSTSGTAISNAIPSLGSRNPYRVIIPAASRTQKPRAPGIVARLTTGPGMSD